MPLPADDPTQRKPDISLAQKVLDWEPKIQLEEGLDALSHVDIEAELEAHSKRKIMRERWRKLGSPQTKIQKSFVYHFFEDTRIYPFYTNGKWSSLSDYSDIIQNNNNIINIIISFF